MNEQCTMDHGLYNKCKHGYLSLSAKENVSPTTF